MGEYKRMLFAVIVAALFIYIWTSFFAKPPQRPASGPGADSTLAGDSMPEERPAIPPGQHQWSPPEQPSQQPQDDFAFEDRPGEEAADFRGGWVKGPEWDSADIETQLCTGRILSSGGGLSSWKLLDFKLLDSKEDPVDLVNLEQGGTSDLHFELLSGDMRVSFDDAPFDLAQIQSDSAKVAKVLRLTATDSSGASIVKTYTFYWDNYYFDLDVTVSGFTSGTGMSCALTWSNGLQITESNEKADLTNFAAISLVGEEFVKDKMGDFKKEPVRTHEGNVIWTGVRSKYFITAMIPIHAEGRAVRTWGSADRNLVATQLYAPMEMAGEGRGKASFRVYAGPMDFERLRAVGGDMDKDLGLEKDVYQRFRFMAPLNHLVFALMKWTHGLIPNYGLVIIVVSVLIKLVFFPLTKSSLKSMQAMKKVQPELEALKKKYKGDPKKMNQAQMELFRKHKVNPMGGCLPILVQMPIFFALYNVLVESVKLRQAPFVGWIDDLSAPETLFHVGTFPIHILPLIMAVTQLAQPTMGPSTDPKQQMMKYIMPVFLLVIFYGLPSGLVLYWTVNNVLTALQQYLMNRSEKEKGEEVTVAPAKPSKRKRRANNK